MNPTHYSTQPRTIRRRVTLVESLGIKAGEGVCYAHGYTTTDTGETAADAFGGRDTYVQKPDSDNNMRFAGVAIKDYDAPANSGTEQCIEIFEPGSTCYVAVSDDVVIGDYRTCTSAGVNHTAGTDGVHNGADVGRFSRAGFPGRGTAHILQTLATKDTAGQERTYATNIDGGVISVASGVVTLTDSGQFTAAEAEVGDFVYILGGNVTASGIAGPISGVHKITSRTDNDAVVIGTEITEGHANIAGTVAYFACTGNPRVLAYLMDGEESGLQEWVNPISAVASAMQEGGFSYIGGGTMTLASDCTATLAEPTQQQFGLKKGIYCPDVCATSSYAVTIENSSGIQADGTTALASLDFDADGDLCVLEWHGSSLDVLGSWSVQHLIGATQA